VHVSRKPNHYALARKLLASIPAGDADGESRSATRTDIVAKPAKHQAGPLPTPDPDDPTVRMAPDRVMALLKAQDALPEPFESTTPGQSLTRILDPDEVQHAQEPPASKPEAKRPFEIVENQPARPPRLPSEFATIPATVQPSAPPRLSTAPLRTRIARMTGLCLMAFAVFSTTFVATRTLRDERSRTQSRALVLRWYDGAAAQARDWFASKPDAALPKAATRPLPAKDLRPSPPRVPSAKPTAGPTATVTIPAAPAEPALPIFQLEDLKPFSECTPPDCSAPALVPSASATKRAPRQRGRTPR
jgi:hypothetical protein